MSFCTVTGCPNKATWHGEIDPGVNTARCDDHAPLDLTLPWWAQAVIVLLLFAAIVALLITLAKD